MSLDQRVEGASSQNGTEPFRILDSIRDGFLTLANNWTITYINHRAAAGAGKEPGDLTGRNIWEAVPTIRGGIVEEKYRQAMARREPVQFEFPGKILPVWYSVNVYPLSDGLTVYWQDITDRKRVESALRESEELFRAAFDDGAIAMSLASPEMKLLRVNAAFCRMLGYSEEELAGSRFLEITHPDDQEANRAGIQRILEGRADYFRMEKRYIRKDGAVIWADMSTAVTRDAQNQPICFVTHIQDITDRKVMEESLRHLTETLEKRVVERTRQLYEANQGLREQATELVKSRENFDCFFNTIDDLLFVADTEGLILHVNHETCRRLGYAEAELIGQSVCFVHPPERWAEARGLIAGLAAGMIDVCPIPLVTKTGEEIPVETRVLKGHWNGHPALFGVSKDVSKLKRSEEKFSRAFHSSPVLTAISTIADGRYVDVNDAFLTTLGFTREEVIGRTSAELNLFADPLVRDSVVGLVEKQGYARNVEVRVCSKDQKIRWGMFSADRIAVGDEPCWLTTMLDITERKLAVEALHEKNAALDKSVAQLRKLAMELTQAEERERKRLATKLHDDVQQLLVAATMKISLIDQKASALDHARTVGEALSLVGEALDASRSLTTDLYPPVLLDGGLLPGLRWLAERMREKHGLTVDVAAREIPDVPAPLSIMVFEGVRELLFNIVKHSGVLAARVTVKRTDSRKISVEVTDRGRGFSGDLSVSPFSSGRLGLFHLRERLAYIGGSLDVASEPGKGSSVSITIPLAQPGV